jgi:hypothetical protein
MHVAQQQQISVEQLGRSNVCAGVDVHLETQQSENGNRKKHVQ